MSSSPSPISPRSIEHMKRLYEAGKKRQKAMHLENFLKKKEKKKKRIAKLKKLKKKRDEAKRKKKEEEAKRNKAKELI